MSKVKVVLFVFALLLLAANSGFAASYAVGSCLPKLPSFPAIYQAIYNAPSGSTIMICPGTYYEQLQVYKSVNLKGVVSGGSSRVVIKPGTTMYQFTDCVNSYTYTPVVEVFTSPVNISNITVDGNGTVGTGISYSCGAAGTLSQVTVRNLAYAPHGGVWLHSTWGDPMVLQNSSVHDIQGIGVVVDGDVPATIKNNVISATVVALEWNTTGGTVTGNVFTGEGFSSDGVAVLTGGTFSGNTLENVGYGLEIWATSGLNFVSNKIDKANYGIAVIAPPSSSTANIIKSNTISRSNTGFEFYCIPTATSGNTISDTSVGIDSLPSSVSAPNTFVNVDTVQTNPCP